VAPAVRDGNVTPPREIVAPDPLTTVTVDGAPALAALIALV
jgi:hypothetical protein